MIFRLEGVVELRDVGKLGGSRSTRRVSVNLMEAPHGTTQHKRFGVANRLVVLLARLL